jgi:hypothetical protein
MKNTMKIMLALLTSVSLVSSATAGELTVTGTAKATMNLISGGSLGALNNTGRTLGITNEIDFGATGELDNGMSWKYQVQFDPGAGGSDGVDDTRLELTTTYGTLGLYVSEGGLDVDNAASQSVYGRPSDIGLSTGMVDGPGIGGYNNIQLHTPAGLLPFDTSIKVAYAPGNDSGVNSGNAKNAGIDDDSFTGSSTEQYQIKATPMDGVKVGADYYTRNGGGNAVELVVQQYEAGSIFATYATGPVSIGLSRTLVAPLILGSSAALNQTAQSNTGAAEGNAAAARQYTNNKMSAAYNVNDALSVSLEVERSKREKITDTSQNGIKSQAIQAAYTMGGMTLSVSHGTTANVGYKKDNDVQQTLFAMAMAF